MKNFTLIALFSVLVSAAAYAKPPRPEFSIVNPKPGVDFSARQGLPREHAGHKILLLGKHRIWVDAGSSLVGKTGARFLKTPSERFIPLRPYINSENVYEINLDGASRVPVAEIEELIVAIEGYDYPTGVSEAGGFAVLVMKDTERFHLSY